MNTTVDKIKIFGTTWCGDTRRARNYFADHKIEYEWIDIDMDKEAEKYVLEVNNGNRSVPTILFPDGSILVEPGTYQLNEKFKES